MAATAESQETASLADFLQILRVRRALIALILALVVVTTAAVTAFLSRWYLDVDRSDSDDPARNLRRTRISLGATRSF